MSYTTDAEGLYRLCLQDLRAGRLLAVAQLPLLTARVGAPLADDITELARSYHGEIAELAALGGDGEAPENLWMGGVLDDAKRDTETIATGPLLDIAIIGAVRKAIAADAVSLETAEALAGDLAGDPATQDIARIKTRAKDMDGRLRTLLLRLTTGANLPTAE